MFVLSKLLSAVSRAICDTLTLVSIATGIPVDALSGTMPGVASPDRK